MIANVDDPAIIEAPGGVDDMEDEDNEEFDAAVEIIVAF